MEISKQNLYSWIILFYNNGIIQNCEMLKKDARPLFYKSRIDKRQEFGDILHALHRYKICQNIKRNSSVIIFHRKELNGILKQDKVCQETNHKTSPKKLYTCNICAVNFSKQSDLYNHQRKDKQHYFRNLYFNNNSSVKNVSKDIEIEISTRYGSDREVLLLDSGVSTVSNIYVVNNSKNTYILEDIIEVHQSIENVNIPKKFLPITLQSNVELKLDICSNFQEVTTQLCVYVFSLRSINGSCKLDVFKEIMIHVNADKYKYLLPTSKYVKPNPVRNDINPKVCVRLGGPVVENSYVVDLDNYPIPQLLQKVLATGLKAYDAMPVKEYKYLQKIKSLLQESSNGFYLTKDNYFHLLDLLIHMEEYQLSIDIRNYDTETKNLMKVPGYNNRYRLMVPDLAERRPSLLPGDSVFVKSMGTKTYQGVVRLINQDSVILEFNRKFTNKVFMENINLSITYGYNRSIIRAEHRSLDLLTQHRVITPFFPTRILPSTKCYELKWFNGKIELNPQQQQAVRHILARSSYPAPYLIFGPPGTGKTMTIVEAISQVWKMKPKANILVCAPSNSVANEIALRLTSYIPKSQLFRYMSVSFDMYDIPDEVLPFTNYDSGDFYQPTLKEICDYRIVISTLTNASRLVSLGVPARYFSYVFIDESGHATEPETLIPIAGLITSEEHAGAVLGQIVLAGDPEQLGPIIHSSYAKHYGYGISMLERLMTTIDIYSKDCDDTYDPNALTKLLHNYRSHHSILHLPNKLFYDGELVPMGDDLINLALNWEKLPNKEFPIIFHSVVGSDQREANSPSYFNIQEIEVVMRYLTDLIGTRLRGRKIMPKDVGVIAPYRKQVQKIRQACGKKNWTDLTIGSVEQFQGQERLIIIISTVRSQPKLIKFDNKFHLGFLNNPKRFNVALTRAKSLVIVVGNPNLLQYETYWRKFIKYCADNKCMIGSPFQFSKKAVDSLALDMAKLRIDGDTDDTADFSRGNI